METIEQDAPIRDRFHDFRSGARDRTEQQHTCDGKPVAALIYAAAAGSLTDGEGWDHDPILDWVVALAGKAVAADRECTAPPNKPPYQHIDINATCSCPALRRLAV